jgi:Cu+-exporting ATPase
MMKRIDLRITGMTCASCAAAIEKSLIKVEGILESAINPATGTASIRYDDAKAAPADIINAVKNSGYDIIPDSVTLKIGGMTCVMCSKSVDNSLKKLDGIISTDISYASGKARVDYIGSLASLEDFKSAVVDAGYEYLGAQGDEKLEAAWREKSLREKRMRSATGLIAGSILMAGMYLPLPAYIPLHYIMLLISTPVFLFISHPIFIAAWRALKNRNLNMDVMYSMGIGIAYIASVLGTVGVLPHDFMFYETAVFLAAFLTLGRYLEEKARGKTSDTIRKLMKLYPRKAIVITEEGERDVPVENVKIGDIVLVKPGETVPVDGTVQFGESYIDESMLSGEPIPVYKKSGDGVTGGTMNKNGSLKISAGRVGSDTVLAKIIRFVEEAQGSRPPIQKLADRVVVYFIPVILSIAIISFLVWYFVLGSTMLFAFSTLVSILVIACPCALGLATPTAVSVGIGRGAELGILIRNGEALEISEKITSIVFDKTGTITKGVPEISDLYAFGISENDMIAAAAGVEKLSEHPLADPIVKKAEALGITPAEAGSFNSIGGHGVRAVFEGKEIIIGSRRLIENNGISLDEGALTLISKLENEGKTAVLVAISGILRGIIGISDGIKPNAPEAVKWLRAMGLNVSMITGDNERTARTIAEMAGIGGFIAGVLPEDKAVEIKRMQSSGEVVAFVGDGINDAPALAQSDIGISMGSGTDIAMESGDIVLMKSDLRDVSAALQLGRKVMRRIRQNLFWAFAYNGLLVPVAAGLLQPLFNITLKPELAGLAMAMSSITVVTLSLTLRKFLPDALKK